MSYFAQSSGNYDIWSNDNPFFSMYSPLNSVLKQENFTLEQILQEDELIQEVKARNERLIDFLSQKDSAQKLIFYLSKSSEDVSDDIRTLKYPYMSCEVICCGVQSILDAIVDDDAGDTIALLFSLLDSPEPLDNRLSGYFEKVVSILMAKKSTEMYAYIDQHSEQLLGMFVRHLSCFSIAELFKRMLQPFPIESVEDTLEYPSGKVMSCLSNSNEGNPVDSPIPAVKTLRWLEETAVIDALLGVFTEDGSELEERHKHTSNILVDIIHCGAGKQHSGNDSPRSTGAGQVQSILAEYLEKEQVVEAIIRLAVPEEGAQVPVSAVNAAVSILDALLSHHANSQYTETEELPFIVTATIACLPRICACLRGNGYNTGTVWNQQHQQVPRLGLRRIKLVGLIVFLLHTKYHQVDEALFNQNVLSTCLDLFFSFEAVNFLHSEVESIVVGVLESASEILLVSLIQDAQLLSRIIHAITENEQRKPFPFGFMGHLNRICHMIVSLMEECAEMQDNTHVPHAQLVVDLLKKDTATWAQWDEIFQSKLLPKFEQEQHPLGGASIPTHNKEDFFLAGAGRSLNDQFVGLLDQEESPAEDEPSHDHFGLEYSVETPMMFRMVNDSSSDEEDDDNFYETPNGPSETDTTWSNTDHWAKLEQIVAQPLVFDSTPSPEFQYPTQEESKTSLDPDAEPSSSD